MRAVVAPMHSGFGATICAHPNYTADAIREPTVRVWRVASLAIRAATATRLAMPCSQVMIRARGFTAGSASRRATQSPGRRRRLFHRARIRSLFQSYAKTWRASRSACWFTLGRRPSMLTSATRTAPRVQRRRCSLTQHAISVWSALDMPSELFLSVTLSIAGDSCTSHLRLSGLRLGYGG